MLTIQYAKDPVYVNAEGTFINLIVKFEEFADEMPFGATPTDPEEYGRELYANAKAGQYGEVAPYVPPVPTAEQNKKTAISKLQATDWAATVDIANPEYSNPYLTNQDAFLSYRSQIREYAINPIPGFITWPTEPTAIWSNV